MMVRMLDWADVNEMLRRAIGYRDRGIRGRYAPSPSGALHLGNLRTALLSWLHMRLLNGTWVLRMEDLDQPRVRPGSMESIYEDLAWLGLQADESCELGGPLGPYLQSERNAIYHAVLARLVEMDLVYPCICSRRDVAEAARAPHGRSPVYPGTCRLKSDTAERAVRLGRNPSMRVKVASMGRVEVQDEIMGSMQQDLATEIGDFIVQRSDGLFSYQLAVAVDDALMGMTHVLRGSDLADSTPRQVALLQTLGWPVPRYLHVPLMCDEYGVKLSKRDQSLGLSPLRNAGHSPESVIGLLAYSVGLVDGPQPISLKELLSTHTHQTLMGCMAANAAATR